MFRWVPITPDGKKITLSYVESLPASARIRVGPGGETRQRINVSSLTMVMG